MPQKKGTKRAARTDDTRSILEDALGSDVLKALNAESVPPDAPSMEGVTSAENVVNIHVVKVPEPEDNKQQKPDQPETSDLAALKPPVAITLDPEFRAMMKLARGNYQTIAREYPQAIPEVCMDLATLRQELAGESPVTNRSKGQPRPRNVSELEAGDVGELSRILKSQYSTVADAAAALKMSDRMVRRHCESGMLKGVRLGREWLVEQESIRELQNNPPKRGPKPVRLNT
jgi:hypothetical protein